MADPAEDALLTAFLDGELSPQEQESLAVRLSNERELRARLEELQTGEAALRAAFSTALAQAPKANMAAKLRLTTEKRAGAVISWGWRRAAALAAIAFVAGLAASRILFYAPGETESWRQSVAEYMSLYTPATFAPRDEAALRVDLAALSKSVGVDLSTSKLSLGALAPRAGVLLQFQGAPLVQVGYLVDGAPAAFCVIRDGEPDGPATRTRLGDFNAVSWAKGGRGFMLLSAAPAERVEEMAHALQKSVAVE